MTILPRASATLSPQLLLTAVRHNAPAARFFHSSSFKAAIAHPITAHGPPPKAPAPSPEFGEQQKREQQQKQQQEEQQRQEEEVKLAESEKEDPTRLSKPSPLKKRFWRNVDVREKPEEYQVLLDTRPVRTPAKDVLSVPPSKPQLAHAIALEWDVMTTAQQALKNHLIPLTSLTARAADISREDANGLTTVRDQILTTTLRYLDTDTLLCWVPEQDAYSGPPEVDENGQKKETLRDVQVRVAKDIITFLSTKVWPGIEIKPILDEDSIVPASQPQATKDIIRTWIYNLQAHDLAGFERGVLGSKSLLVAARLVAEWSENFRHAQRADQARFGIEEATAASSLEVNWQTGMWGEVEDTHDVDKEDLKRQLGSVIVLVSGETRRS